MMYFEGDTAVSVQKSEIYSLHNNIKVIRVCSSIRYNGVARNGWIKIYWIFNTGNRTVMDRVKFFLAILTLLKQTDLHVTKDLTGSRLN